MTSYNFDEMIERFGTGSEKYDLCDEMFGTTDLLPMWVADMDFRTPDFIVDAVTHRMKDPIFGYTLREEAFFTAVAQWMERRHGWKIKEEWVTFSPGVVSALSIAILALTQPGDKIVVQSPVYPPFYASVEGNDRTLVKNPLAIKEGRYHMDLEHLKSVIDEKTRMIMISNPHNPGGTVWTPEELKALGEICIEYDLILISDEIHSDLVNDGFVHTPAASLSEELSLRTVTCVSSSKTFNAAGLATSGVIIADEAMRKLYDKRLNAIHVGFGNIFGNPALVAAYTQGDAWLDELKAYVGKNLRYAMEQITTHIPEITPMNPEASYLLWMDCSGLGLSQEELRTFMVKEAGLGLNDGESYGEEGVGFMRINLACPFSVVEKAMERLKRAVEKLRA